jgi:hypothetical protein
MLLGARHGRQASQGALRMAAGAPCLLPAGEVILMLVSFVFGAPSPENGFRNKKSFFP